MLPSLGKSPGNNRGVTPAGKPGTAGGRPATQSSGFNRFSAPQPNPKHLDLSDSEDSFGNSESESGDEGSSPPNFARGISQPMHSSKGPAPLQRNAVSAGVGSMKGSQGSPGTLPRALSRGGLSRDASRASAAPTPDARSIDKSRPVQVKEQVIDMSRKNGYDLTDSDSDADEGDAAGRKFLNAQKSKERDRDRDDSTVRTKFGVKIKVGQEIDMQNYHDFDKFGKLQSKGKAKDRGVDSVLSTSDAQRALLEEQADEELDRLDDLRSQRERWELQQQEKRMRAAEAAARGMTEPCLRIAQRWLGEARKNGNWPQGASSSSPKLAARGPGVPSLALALEVSHREDTGRQKLYKQTNQEIQEYRNEVATLAQKEAEQRAILKELWDEKSVLQAKDDKYTAIIWEVRKHILEMKEELDRLLRKKDEAERQLAQTAAEIELHRSGGMDLQKRRQAMLEEMDVLNEERALLEQQEKEQLEALLAMRRQHLLRDKRNRDVQEEIKRVQQQIQDYVASEKVAEEDMKKSKDDMEIARASAEEKIVLAERLRAQKREREREENAAIEGLQAALATLDQQENQILASKDKVANLRLQIEESMTRVKDAEAEVQALTRMLNDPLKVQKARELQDQLDALLRTKKEQEDIEAEGLHALELGEVQLKEAAVRHAQVLQQLAQVQIDRERELEKAADAQRRLLALKKEQESAGSVIAQCREEMAAMEMDRKALDRKEMQVKHDHAKEKAKIEARRAQIEGAEREMLRLREEEEGLHRKYLEASEEFEKIRGVSEAIKAKTVAALNDKVKMREAEDANMRAMEEAQSELEKLRADIVEQQKLREQLDESVLKQKDRLRGVHEGNEGKRLELKRLEEQVEMEGVHLEEQKNKLLEELKRRKEQENSFKLEMARLKQDRVEIETHQHALHEEAKRLRDEKDAAEKRAKGRIEEIERLKKLHEAIAKKEPLLENEEARLKKQLEERQGKETTRNTNIMTLRAEIEALQTGIGDNRQFLDELHRKKAELVGQLAMAVDETRVVGGQIDALEQKLRNRGELSGDSKVQREALENAIAEADRELALLQKQLKEAEARRDAQLKNMDELTKRVAEAQAVALAETERLALSNTEKAELERKLRADLDRETTRNKELSGRLGELDHQIADVNTAVSKNRAEVEERQRILQQKLDEKKELELDAETRTKNLERLVKEAEERWAGHEQHEVSDQQKALMIKLREIEERKSQIVNIKAEHQHILGEHEKLKVEEGLVRDEIARDVRHQLDLEKALDRARKDLTNLRLEIEPLQKQHNVNSEEIKRLQERKGNADALAAEQNKQLEALRENYKTVEVRKREREAEMLDLRKKLNSKDFSAAEQVAELERLRAEEMARRKEIEAALEKARKDFAPLPVTEQELRDELERLQKGIMDKQQTIRQLQDEIDRLRITDELLRADVAILEGEYNDMRRLKEEWPAREAEMKKEIEEAMAMQKAVTEREEQGRREVAQVIEAAHERGEKLKGLEAELAAGQQKLADLEAEERRLRDSRALLEKANLERARVQEKKVQELEELKTEMERAELKAKDDEASLKKKQQELQEMNERNQENNEKVSAELKKLQQWEADQKQEMADMRKKRIELERDDARMREEHAKLRADTEAMASSQTGVEREMAEMRRQLEGMRAAHEGGSQTLKELKDGLHDYQERAMAQKRAMDQTRAEKEAAEAAVRDAQESVERLKREVEASAKNSADLEEQKKKLEQMRRGLASAEEEHKKVLQDLQAASIERKKLDEEQQKKIDALKKDAQAAEAELRGVREEIARLDAEKAARDARLGASHEQLERLKKERDSFQNSAQTVEQQIAQLQKDKEAAKEREAQLTDQKESVERERAGLVQRAEERAGELSRLRAERDLAEKSDREEERELKQLRDYEKQLREQQIKRMEELEKQRALQREEEKRQREHEAALEQLRNMRNENQKKDLESLQELERLQKEKEKLDKRQEDQRGEIERLREDIAKKDKERKEKKKKAMEMEPVKEDDTMSMMSEDTSMLTSRTNEEEEKEATTLTEEEKKEWAKEGKSELDKKYLGIFSRARHGRYVECERILKSDVAVDVVDEFGNTPLIVACQNGKKRLAKLFLRYKAKINTQNAQGNTVLHYCFTYGYGDLGDYLISKGAKADIKNNNGLTCYEGLDRTRQASARPSARGSRSKS